jgi:hypothetical protein
MKKTVEDLRAMREELCRPPGARGRDGRDEMTCSTFSTCQVRRQR